MAPIKFEENIREKLQERELAPSKGAWDVLSSRLDEAPKNKNNTFFWMAIAASFVGVLIIATSILNNNGAVDETQVADEEVKIEEQTQKKVNELFVNPEEQKSIIASENDALDKVLKENEQLEKTTNRVSEKAVAHLDDVTPTKKQDELDNKGLVSDKAKKVDQIIKQAPKVDKGIIAAVAKDKVNKTSEQIDGTVKLDKSEKFITSKIDEVVAQVKADKGISPEEIDALLARAQEDIALNRILNQAHGKIDALALLNDVELEMEDSFRGRIFEALGEGFNKVRTAVSERNN